jgi:raffinose/stachyose/melibiose transport system permease protein
MTELLEKSTTLSTGKMPVSREASIPTRTVKRALRRNLRAAAGLYLIIAPTFILLAIFSVVPFVWAFAKSFYEFEIGSDPRFVGVSNYAEYFRDVTFTESFANMLFLTTWAVCVVIVVPLTVAKLIFSLTSPRASYVYRILFLIPIVVPGVATQLIWQGLIYSDIGLVNEAARGVANLLALPRESLTHGWLNEPRTVLWAIAFVGFPFCGGINILIYYAGLTSIPDSVHEAAILDGATGLKKFILVDVPLVMSQIKLLVMLTIIGGVQAFEGIFILTRGGPGFESMVPGLWMYFNAFSFQKFGYACAIGVILFVVIMTLTIINLKYFRSAEDITATAR